MNIEEDKKNEQSYNLSSKPHTKVKSHVRCKAIHIYNTRTVNTYQENPNLVETAPHTYMQHAAGLPPETSFGGK